MRITPAFVLILGLSGCSGAPLVSSGLSSQPNVASVQTLPEPTALPAARPMRRVVQRRTVVRVAAPAVRHVAPANGDNDEAADRATRELDREANRLEAVARQATGSICRGC